VNIGRLCDYNKGYVISDGDYLKIGGLCDSYGVIKLASMSRFGDSLENGLGGRTETLPTFIKLPVNNRALYVGSGKYWV